MQESHQKQPLFLKHLCQIQFPENQLEDSGCCLQVHREGFPLPYISYLLFSVNKRIRVISFYLVLKIEHIYKAFQFMIFVHGVDRYLQNVLVVTKQIIF